MKAPQRNAVQRVEYMISMYRFYLRIYFRNLVEYRLDTWIALIAGFLAQVCTLAFISIVFGKIPQLAGWSFYELMFIFGLAVTGREINKVFLNAPYSVTGYIRSGMLDVFMIRPLGPLFQTIGMSQEINGIGSSITALFILGYAAYHLDIQWTLGSILYLCTAIVSSVLIIFSVLLMISVCTFWILEIRSLVNVMGWIHEFVRYPLDIFNPFIRGLLTYIIPFSLGSFYPAAYILRPEKYYWVGWTVPVVALGLTVLAYSFWRFGLKRYSSASG